MSGEALCRSACASAILGRDEASLTSGILPPAAVLDQKELMAVPGYSSNSINEC